MRVLVTGGAGYIGSHTLVELLAEGHEVCVVDNHANSSPESLSRVRDIAGRDFAAHALDVRDTAALTQLAQEFRPDTVIHFAGLKAVGEGEENPLSYYEVNVGGTLSLLRAMEAASCGRIIFSSSATVYGMPQYLPYDEDHPLAPVSVYGRTKRIAEDVLRDWTAARVRAAQPAAAILLRYFNPVGAHESGRIGEDPRGEPQNLMPYLAQVATGQRSALRIFGDDWPTPDGTGIRDYIHVVDLARAHVAALNRAARIQGAEACNIGTGQGVSVHEMLAAFSRAVGRALPYEIAPRRAGDLAESRAACAHAADVLGWAPVYGLQEMVESLWRWQSQNPGGYGR